MWQLLWGHRRYEKCYNRNPEDTAEDTGCNWHQPNPKIRVGVKVLGAPGCRAGSLRRSGELDLYTTYKLDAIQIVQPGMKE